MMNNFINFRFVFKVISRTLLIIAAALMTCVALAIYFNEDSFPFIFSSIFASFLGTILYITTLKQTENVIIYRREAYLTVTLSWLVIALIGSLPYLFSGSIPSFINALFESMSGFTTTG